MARDPKTEPKPTAEPSELPRLTDKQFAFVKGVAGGMSLSDAYRDAYNVKDWLDNSIWCEASKLRANTKVVQWLSAAQEGMSDITVTKESHTRELKRLANVCETTGNMGASVKATELMGRVNGLYVDQIETRNPDAKALIEQIMQLPQELRGPVATLAGLSESDLDLPTQH